MRLEGQAKLGYYPTPELTLKFIQTWLRADGAGPRRYLDPCAGKGEALAAIAAAHGPAETYGIELSDARADSAKQVLSHVINTGYEYAALTDETFSLVLLNPPYDGETETGGGVRLEETFLLNTTSRIVPGGILIYIVPHARLANDRIARHLLGWYSNLQCFKLPQEEYVVFKQIVIFGVRRAEYKAPNADAMREVMDAWAMGQIITGYTETLTPDKKKLRPPHFAEMPYLTAGNGEYVIPLSPLKGKHGAAFRFQYQMISEEDMLHEAEATAERLDASREWADLVPPTEPPIIEPAMLPKQGHVAMQVSGGLLGTNLVANRDGQPVLLKGNVRKYTVRKQDDIEEIVQEIVDDDEKPALRKVVLEERFQTLLTTLDADGTLVTQSDPEAIRALLDQYVAQLAEIVRARNVPLYDMRPEAWEWAAFDQLSKGRLLPGQKEPGLTPFQKHLAIALGRLCLKYGADFCNAEMASGKSRIGLAIAEYLRVVSERKARNAKHGPYPALIIGPGIVTGDENWPKEIKDTIPDADSRVITIGVKPVPKPVKLGQYLQQIGFTLREEDFEGLSASSVGNRLNDAARRQGIAVSPLVWNAIHDALDRAEKHPPARRKGTREANLLDGRIGGYAWLGLDIPRDETSAREIAAEYSLAQFVREYRAGLLPPKIFAILSFETAKLASGRVPAVTTRHIKVTRRNEDADADAEWTEIVRVCACPVCGAVVSGKYDEQGQPITPILPNEVDEWVGTKRRFCQAPLMYFNPHTQRYEPGKRVWDEDKGKHIIRTKDDAERDAPYICGAPLFQNTALRREAAARYVLKKARGFFGLLLCDEIHKAKAKGTGVGWTLTALSQAVRYTVGLTGTLFGGNSTSIFWLMYRLAADVRREFGFNDERRWAERYGLLKTTFYVPEDVELQDDGAYTGTHFFETVSERPGISPAIVGLGLRYCTFSSLKDVGLPLPAYSEEVVRIPMTTAMEDQMAEADGSRTRPPTGLLAWALEMQKEETGKGAISVWLNTAFHRPNAMFRDETVFFNRRLSGRGRYAVRRKQAVRHFAAVTGPDEILPKERWLAETCCTEKRQGRKTLVYVRQTGERDIQPRLAEMLTQHGLRVGIVRASLAPRKRATWIAKNAPRFDVLLANPRLVETGLNLTMFATAVFFELEFSLYVLWQAMRRLYRPGAPLPVKIYFPVYEGTLEEQALNLIGSKMMAAQCFYGDSVGGALVEEGDEGDLINDLVRQALGELRAGHVESLFTASNSSTSDAENVVALPISSLLITPPILLPTAATLADLWAQHRALLKVKTKRKSTALTDQLSLL